MLIASLQVRSFRNYADWQIEPAPGLTILLGPNASGKTNAIEAVQLITTGASFRRPHWGDLVLWGEEQAGIKAEFTGLSSAAMVEMRIQASGHRSVFMNGVSKRKVSDVTGILPSVLSHQMIQPREGACGDAPIRRR